MITTQTRLSIAIGVSALICALCIYNFCIMSSVVGDYNASGLSIAEYETEKGVKMKDVYTSYMIYFGIFIIFLLTIIFCISQSIELQDRHLQIIFNNTSFLLFGFTFLILLGMFTTTLRKYNQKIVFYIDVAIIVLLSLVLTMFIYNLTKNRIRLRGSNKYSSSKNYSSRGDYSSYGDYPSRGDLSAFSIARDL